MLQSLGLQAKKYGLCVSTLEPRKRIAELLAGWRRLPTEVRRQYPLALAGGKGWLNDALQDDIDRGVAEGWVRHLGFIPQEMLPALYRGARLFVYPSIYEGFGLPPLEAMACGTPVLVSNRSCLPEVCGDAVAYLDPDDPDQMLSSIEQALTDQQWLQAASQKALVQASRYSWEKCVEETVAIYRKIAGFDAS
jgi:alpha-1,3-rhamnosyl/mannosyltransferase